MIKFNKKFSYKHRIAFVILLFALFPYTLLASLSLKNVRSNVKAEMLSDYQNVVDSNSIIISKTITELESKMIYVLNNYDLRKYLFEIDNLTLTQILDLLNETDKMVNSITATAPNMSVRLYPYKSTYSYGDYFYTLEVFSNELLQNGTNLDYDKILALNEGEFLWKIQTISRQTNKEAIPQTCLCLYTQVNYINNKNCILEFSIPVDELTGTHTTELVADCVFFIYMKTGIEPLIIPIQNLIDPVSYDSLLSQYIQTSQVPGYEVVQSTIPNAQGSQVIILIPQSHFSSQMLSKTMFYLAITVLIAIMILCVSYYTSHLLTHKIILTINMLNTDLDNIMKTKFPSIQNSNDFDQITFRIHKLILDTQEYCRKIEQYEMERLRMELELLQMQFNPHLLYNTLGTIRSQVKNPVARDSIDSLCDYYRIMLNNGHLFIQLKDEVNMIKEYIKIVTFAYCLNDITYEFQIEDNIEHHMIIKHLLQPIVENAINHGIRPTKHGGHLRITMCSEDSLICIHISDNGIGIPPEKAARLLKEPSASVNNGGYGIYNVQQRIQLHYGKEYGLSIESTLKEGTTVSLRIPKVEANLK